MNALRLASTVNLAWITIYTAGLTSAQRERRIDEIASDRWEHETLFRSTGYGDVAIARQVASRWVRGVLADVLWRMEAGRDGEAAVTRGESPPLPFLTMCLVACVLVFGAGSTAFADVLLDLRTVGTSLGAVFGAALLWWGLYLASSRFCGPLLIAIGTLFMAWGLWWTVAGPLVAVTAGIAGLRRAQRLDRLRELT